MAVNHWANLHYLGEKWNWKLVDKPMNNWYSSPLPPPCNLFGWFHANHTNGLREKIIVLNSQMVESIKACFYWALMPFARTRIAARWMRLQRRYRKGLLLPTSYDTFWEATVPRGDVCSKLHLVKGKKNSCGQEGNLISKRWYLTSIKASL